MEWNTGVLIADLFEERSSTRWRCHVSFLQEPWTVYLRHQDAHEAVHNAVVLEEVAKMARCEMINPDVKEAPQCLRINIICGSGTGAYYGQGNFWCTVHR